MRYAIIAGFVLMVAAQWYAPLSMVYDSQKTVDQGTEYKFKTEPVDPTDPFRGKYITLAFDAENYYPDDTSEAYFPEQEEIYALLTRDPAGFAKVVQLTQEQPDEDQDYITTHIYYVHKDSYDRMLVNLDFPFTRYYLEESKASEAERLYWSSGRDSTAFCYAKVSVHKGKSTLTDVMIGDKSIVEIIRELNASED